MEHRPLVIAHRGASAHATDNSLEAFALAVEHGADGIETDARFTRDRQVVLSHDAVVPGVGVLAEIDLAGLRARRPAIPTLEEALPVTGNLLLNIEIKNFPRDPDFDPLHTMAEPMVGWIDAHDLRERALVSSFNPDTVARVRDLDDSIATGLLLEHGRGIADEIGNARAAGHRWIMPRSGAVRLRTRRLVERVHLAGMKLGTWTVDRSSVLQSLGRAGIDAVITNDPALAVEIYS